MSFAYEIQPRQIVGGPAWRMTGKYDIVAVTPEQPDGRQLKGMVRKLLTERFGLSFHREKRTLPAYVLVLDSADTKMEKSDADANRGSSFRGRGMGHLTETYGSMPDFARWLNSGILDRPVIDQTGLTGKFNFTLNWTPDESQYGGMGSRVPPTTDNASALPGFFTAIKEQTALKMDATKVNVDVLVIDHVEKPTENQLWGRSERMNGSAALAAARRVKTPSTTRSQRAPMKGKASLAPAPIRSRSQLRIMPWPRCRRTLTLSSVRSRARAVSVVLSSSMSRSMMTVR
jgi:uncharacterized protein (TIGR03435 family)